MTLSGHVPVSGLQTSRRNLLEILLTAVRETETLAGKLAVVSAKDWQALLQQMHAILATEGELAVFIGDRFRQLASDAHSAGDSKTTQSIRDAVAAFSCRAGRRTRKTYKTGTRALLDGVGGRSTTASRI
jgi:hypothetical protein